MSDYDLRDKIKSLGMTQSGFARRMIELGDDRDIDTIKRALYRMLNGNVRISGEMRALVGSLELLHSQKHIVSLIDDSVTNKQREIEQQYNLA